MSEGSRSIVHQLVAIVGIGAVLAALVVVGRTLGWSADTIELAFVGALLAGALTMIALARRR